MVKTSSGSSGFTLLEAVVSLSILALLSTILLVGAAAARRQAVVRSAAQQVAGFLRETRGLSLNGVKNPGCDEPLNQRRPECSQYRVDFNPPSEYIRSAVGGGAVVRGVLPAGAVFSPVQRVTFRYKPPTIEADPATSTTITHGSGSPRWTVCVTALGSVEVRSGGSC
ncbi:MAG: prepilin-type N-terminal cleavage/methylation domain-containing protein [bacterium]|nr:prepilin-type N-terminal cleavage/methylation domain-containing protein [bacterium]